MQKDPSDVACRFAKIINNKKENPREAVPFAVGHKDFGDHHPPPTTHQTPTTNHNHNTYPVPSTITLRDPSHTQEPHLPTVPIMNTKYRFNILPESIYNFQRNSNELVKPWVIWDPPIIAGTVRPSLESLWNIPVYIIPNPNHFLLGVHRTRQKNHLVTYR